MGLIPFRSARRVDADTVGIYKDGLTPLLSIDDSTAANYITIMGRLGTGKGLLFYANEIDATPRLVLMPGSALTLYPETNQDCHINTAGIGVLRFGVHTGSGDVTCNGSIEIKDDAGTVRKLMTTA